MKELSENNGSAYESKLNSNTAVATDDDCEQKIKLDEDVKVEHDLKLEPEEVKVKMELEEDKDAALLGEIASGSYEENDFEAVQVRQESPGEVNVPTNEAPVGLRSRTKGLVVYVEVPTLAEVKQRREGIKALGKLLKPKIKKAENLQLSLHTVYDRLKAIGIEPYPVGEMDPEKRELIVPRIFISNVYGGSPQVTFPRPRKEKADEHGMTKYACMNGSLQPLAPARPGAPGLFLDPGGSGARLNRKLMTAKPGHDLLQILGLERSRHTSPVDHETDENNQKKRKDNSENDLDYSEDESDDWGKAIPTFTSVQDNPVLWQYEGIYTYKKADPHYLTAREWQQQRDDVKRKWGLSIYNHKSWGSFICARVFGRKLLHRELTLEEQGLVVSCGRHKDIEPDDVSRAFQSGQELMAMWTMKCVGYDTNFQMGIYDNFQIWKANKQEKKKGGNGAPRKKKRSKKSKPESDDEESFENEDEDERPPSKRRRIIDLSPELGEAPSKPRSSTQHKRKGTRARPITLV